VREILLAMQQEYLIELGDAMAAVRHPNRRIKLNQLFQPVTVSRRFWFVIGPSGYYCGCSQNSR
jgi:uncharacterized membrane protein